MLGGPGGQVYLGCRYPADRAYRGQVIADTETIGRHLADEGVTGPFAIDFIVVDADSDAGSRTYLSEINLRLGGTTHPFEMARMVLGADVDAAADGLASVHGPRVYVASDNIKEPALTGRSPSEIITRVADAGLAFDPATHTGVTLHLLGAVTRYGKLGAVAIAADHDTAERLYTAVLGVLRSDR